MRMMGVHVGRTPATVLLAICAIASLGSVSGDWPAEMTVAEISARTNVHDGYVFHVSPLLAAPVEQSLKVTASQSTLDYVAGYSPKLKKWMPLSDGRVVKGLTQIGV